MVACITTRRAAPVADQFEGKLCAYLVLAEALQSRHTPFAELAAADVVLLEVPPTTQRGFELQLLSVIRRLQALIADLLVVVQPSLRRTSNKASWV